MSVIPDRSYPASLFKTPAQRLLRDEEAFATPLLVLATDVLDVDFLEWTPATIAISLAEEIGVTPIDENFARLFAAIQLRRHDDFYQKARSFIELSNGLVGGVTFEIPSILDTNWAVLEASLIAPSPLAKDDSLREAFSPEIQEYLRILCVGQGYSPAPALLKQAMAPLTIQDDVSFLTADPEMYQAIAQAQFEPALEVDRATEERLARMIGQLQDLAPHLREESSRQGLQDLVKQFSEVLT